MDVVYLVGVDKVFGVLGDFNLVFLDDIIVYNDIKWIGNINEFNVSYVVDGYVCINGIGVMVIIFGVGELSVVNGIVGFYVECVLVIVIIGVFIWVVE